MAVYLFMEAEFAKAGISQTFWRLPQELIDSKVTARWSKGKSLNPSLPSFLGGELHHMPKARYYYFQWKESRGAGEDEKNLAIHMKITRFYKLKKIKVRCNLQL